MGHNGYSTKERNNSMRSCHVRSPLLPLDFGSLSIRIHSRTKRRDKRIYFAGDGCRGRPPNIVGRGHRDARWESDQLDRNVHARRFIAGVAPWI
jgi:hypothetical protein